MYSIMVREKTQSRLVKHPDSLWETSVVCSGSMAKDFPDNTAEKYLEPGSSLSHQVFLVLVLCLSNSRVCPSLCFSFPLIQDKLYTVQWR